VLTFDKPGQSSGINLNQLPDLAMNVVEAVCGMLTRPIDMILRPRHATRYFSPLVIFGSTFLMIFLPIFWGVGRVVVSMVPFLHVPPPMGLFSLGSLSKCYFLLSLAHSVRIYKRMMHPETEEHSYYEGPPLPFFQFLPKGKEFWVTRIVLEPAFVFLTASVLEHIFIFQGALATYLQFASFALAMKSFIAWYRQWEYIRNILDLRFAGPVIARMSDNTATQDDLAQIHLASFPKDLPEDIRRDTVSHIAQEYTVHAH